MSEFTIAALELCGGVAAAIVGLGLLNSSVYLVRQQTEAIVEKFGKFNCVAGPGIHFKAPLISKVVVTLDRRLTQHDFKVQIRTQDNAFVSVPVSLHRKVTNTKEAYYELNNAEKQMESFASNVVRAKGAQMSLAELYEAQDDIKIAIKETLDDRIGKFGYVIEDVVVSQPEPSNEVKASFDKVISSQRALEAAKNEAEAQKIKTVKGAEAEAEAMGAYGRGIANQRIEIAKGFKEAIDEMSQSGMSPEESMALMVMINSQEAMIKASANDSTVIVGTVRGDSALNDYQDLTARFSALKNVGRTPSAGPKR